MPKGKVPAYIYNGTLYEDSQLGYSQLVGSQLLPNLDAGLDASQKAISTAFRRLIENHLIPIMSLERWRDSWPSSRDHLFLTSVPMPFRVVLGWFIQRGVLKSLYGMGTARFTDPELYEILVPEDLEAIATQLGDKQWILGSRTPSTTDAALFGFLATAVYWAEFSPRVTSEILWVSLSPFSHPSIESSNHIRRKHPNLISFFQRLRERCWPEWQDPVVLADYNVAPSGSGTPRRSPRRRNVGAG